MKLKVFAILFSIFFLTASINAQVGMSDVMGILVNGIKPSAFTSGKSGKTDLISQLSGINATDN